MLDLYLDLGTEGEEDSTGTGIRSRVYLLPLQLRSSLVPNPSRGPWTASCPLVDSVTPSRPTELHSVSHNTGEDYLTPFPHTDPDTPDRTETLPMCV